MENSTAKSFREIYKAISTDPLPPDPKAEWINRIAKITMRSEARVRAWISGQSPDILVQSIIEKELGVPRDVLFPKDK